MAAAPGTTTPWRAPTPPAHLAALDLVYTGVIEDHRAAIEAVGRSTRSPRTSLIGQTADLEQFQWFVRAHLQGVTGELVTTGASGEVEAAEKASRRIRKR